MLNWLKRLMCKNTTVYSPDCEFPKLEQAVSTFNGKEVAIEEVQMDRDYQVFPGDSFTLAIDDPIEGRVIEVRKDFEEPMLINRAVIFAIEGELGFKKALGGAFGERE